MEQAEVEEKLKNMSPEELLTYKKQNCIFCYIASGKVPAKKVYEDDKVYAILDKNPAAEGHILLLPKEHHEVMPQVPADIQEHLFIVAKSISQAQLAAFQAKGVTLFIANGGSAGQRAHHFMIHLIPRKEGDTVGLKLKQNTMTEGILRQVIERLAPKVKEVLGYERAHELAKESEKQLPPKTKAPKEATLEPAEETENEEGENASQEDTTEDDSLEAVTSEATEEKEEAREDEEPREEDTSEDTEASDADEDSDKNEESSDQPDDTEDSEHEKKTRKHDEDDDEDVPLDAISDIAKGW